MMLRWAAVVIMLAAIAACDGSDQSAEGGDASRSTVRSPAAVPQAESGPCSILEPETVAKLTGEELVGTETVIPGSDLPSCAYGRPDATGLQVSQVPASEWARALPGLVDGLSDSGALGDPGLRRQLEEGARLIERGSTMPPEQACALFSDMLELRSGVAGLDRDIAYLPDREDPQAVTAQACIDGTFTSLVVGGPDLEVRPDVATTIGKVLLEIT